MNIPDRQSAPIVSSLVGRPMSARCCWIQRANPPFQGCWALPGGFLDANEPIDQAAARELQEETGLSDIEFEQLAAYGSVDRDPRTRVVTIAYLAVVDVQRCQPKAADDAADAQWHSLRQLPTLAFDHQTIVDDALRRMRNNCLLYTSPSPRDS